MIKKLGKYIGIYSIGILLMICALTLVALIPQNMIINNAQASADHIEQFKADAHYMIDGNITTYVDDYADLMWLNIAYNMDSEHPFHSAISCSYYYKDLDVVTSYHDTVYNQQQANTDYSRYWHGSLIIIRPLLTFLNVGQIYILNIFVLLGLFIGFMFMLYKRKLYSFAISFGIGLLLIGAYTVPFCMEYVPVFVIMFVTSMLIMKVKDYHVFPLLFISGMLTCYFDFLTAETLTVTIPALLYLVMKYKDGYWSQPKDMVLWLIKAGFIWGCGYALTFGTKWALVYLVDGKASFLYAISQFERRVYVLTATNRLIQLGRAVLSPVLHIFPLALGKTYGDFMLLGFAVVLISGTIGIAFSHQKLNKGLKWCFLILAIVPFSRFLVLNNHAYVHPMFVYRALLITIMVLIYSFIEKSKKENI